MAKLRRIARRRGGFTLVELLVVIGIIVVLLGILVPVISQVRQAAYEADSKQRIGVIQNAIDQYYATFNAYPGVFSNGQITSNSTGLTDLTMTENCVLALMGGLDQPIAFDPNDVGKGPLSMNPANPKRYGAYIDAAQAGLVPKPWSGPWRAAGDSLVPEFMDRYPDPMPIVYLRARVGAQGIVDSDTTPTPPGSESKQYNDAHLVPYFGALTSVFGSGKDFASPSKYIENPSLAGQPRQKDRYLLIGAGKDRKFGTKDDIGHGF